MTFGLLAGLFLFILAAVSAAGYVFVLRPSQVRRRRSLNIPPGHFPEPAGSAGRAGGVRGHVPRVRANPFPCLAIAKRLRRQLVMAGYRWPSAVAIFLGHQSGLGGHVRSRRHLGGGGQ